jgi:predicted  nucleic acid-binding Zn-ribbon protein
MATTKIKKVETPIDERETFVSLQKSFADSEANIQEKLKTLYALQEADNEIEKIVQLRGELPAEVEALEGDVAAIEGKIEHANALIEEYLHSIEDNKQSIIDYDAQIEKYKEQLDNISNSREYDSINKELENQDLLRQIAVKNIGELRMAIEEKRDLLEELGRRLEIRNEDLAAKRDELSVIKESTASEEEKLRVRRDALAAKIDARTMSAYTRIRQSVHNHLAVVPVFNGDSCGGCFNTVTPQRLIEIASGKKLVICEHCGRIIVNPNAE